MPVVPKQVLPLQLFVPIVALRVNACIVCVSVRLYWEKGTGGKGARARVCVEEKRKRSRKKRENKGELHGAWGKKNKTNKQNKQ